MTGDYDINTLLDKLTINKESAKIEFQPTYKNGFYSPAGYLQYPADDYMSDVVHKELELLEQVSNLLTTLKDSHKIKPDDYRFIMTPVYDSLCLVNSVIEDWGHCETWGTTCMNKRGCGFSQNRRIYLLQMGFLYLTYIRDHPAEVDHNIGGAFRNINVYYRMFLKPYTFL